MAVARCIGLDADHLCRACLTGKYPTQTGERLYQLALRNRHGTGSGRTYDVPTVAAFMQAFQQQHYKPKLFIAAAGPDQGGAFTSVVGTGNAAGMITWR